MVRVSTPRHQAYFAQRFIISVNNLAMCYLCNEDAVGMLVLTRQRVARDEFNELVPEVDNFLMPGHVSWNGVVRFVEAS